MRMCSHLHYSKNLRGFRAYSQNRAKRTINHAWLRSSCVPVRPPCVPVRPPRPRTAPRPLRPSSARVPGTCAEYTRSSVCLACGYARRRRGSPQDQFAQVIVSRCLNRRRPHFVRPRRQARPQSSHIPGPAAPPAPHSRSGTSARSAACTFSMACWNFLQSRRVIRLAGGRVYEPSPAGQILARSACVSRVTGGNDRKADCHQAGRGNGAFLHGHSSSPSVGIGHGGLQS